MIKCELTGRNFEIDEKLKAYVEEKLGGLEKYLPRQVRETANCAVVLEDDPSGREDNRYVCEAVLTVQGSTLVSREGTVNEYAAVDIVEAKLRSQLATYKDKFVHEPRRGRMMSQWLGRKTPTPGEVEAASEIDVH